MSERKEIMKKVEEEKALRKALKEINKDKKKVFMKKLASLIKKGLVGVKVLVVWLGGKLVTVFKIAKAFGRAVNIQISVKLSKMGKENPEKLGKLFTRGITATAVIALLVGLNIGDKDISIKEVSDKEAKIENQIKTAKGKGESVVMAGEIGTEEAEKVNKGKSVDKTSSSSNDKVKKVVSNDEVDVYVVGKISTKFELGTEDMGTVIKTKTGETKYGQFSSDKNREDYVIGFFKYMKENYADMYNNNFAGSGAPGSDSLNDNWKKASEKEGAKFNKIQVEYKWNNIIKPTVDKVKDELKVDLTKTLLLQELIYSTVSQYGSEKTFEIVKNAKLNDKMSDIEILNAVQDEKEASLGKYTYTDAEGNNEDYRKIIKDRINSERIALSRLTGKKAENI